MQVLFTVAQCFTMNVLQGDYQNWHWFYDFYAPILSLGSWLIAGGLFLFLIHVYLYRIQKGRSWFDAMRLWWNGLRRRR